MGDKLDDEGGLTLPGSGDMTDKSDDEGGITLPGRGIDMYVSLHLSVAAWATPVFRWT